MEPGARCSRCGSSEDGRSSSQDTVRPGTSMMPIWHGEYSGRSYCCPKVRTSRMQQPSADKFGRKLPGAGRGRPPSATLLATDPSRRIGKVRKLQCFISGVLLTHRLETIPSLLSKCSPCSRQHVNMKSLGY
uniref:Uncharacterized protein n=1 Tax=Molossus molossus TaxID=27622 RepID=A0A7J8F8T4_MOLMO|nr:hypothetical protein HJG59_008487 [Molossus molossus]